MKRIATISLLIASLLMIAAPVAFATTVNWKGLDWTIRGTANTATVIGDYLSISVVGGNSADPEPDNWALTTSFTTAKWMQFTFTDPGGTTGYSPRAYSEGHILGGGDMLMQGGSQAPYDSRTLTNMHVWTTGWVFGNWKTVYTNRPVGDHTFKVGLGSNGEVDFFYDGNLVKTYRIGQYYPSWNGTAYENVQFTWQADYLNLAYLGVDTALGQSGTIIYKDFTWGTEYTPVPLPGTLVLLGSGLAGLAFWRRRRASLKA